MKTDKLRAALNRSNLSLLARLSGVDLRLLRRIRNVDCEPRATTVDKITPHLAKARTK